MSTNQKIEVLDKKWSDRFNRLEDLLLSKAIDRPQEPTFTVVKVTPTHAPPASAIRPEPFMKPREQQSSQQPDRPPISDLLTTDSAKPSAAAKTGSVPSQSSNWPGISDMTDQSTAQRPFSGVFDITRKDKSSELDSDSDLFDRPPVDLYPEEGELSDDQEVSFTDPDNPSQRNSLIEKQ